MSGSFPAQGTSGCGAPFFPSSLGGPGQCGKKEASLAMPLPSWGLYADRLQEGRIMVGGFIEPCCVHSMEENGRASSKCASPCPFPLGSGQTPRWKNYGRWCFYGAPLHPSFGMSTPCALGSVGTRHCSVPVVSLMWTLLGKHLLPPLAPSCHSPPPQPLGHPRYLLPSAL